MKDRLALKGKFVEFYYKSLLVYLYDECFRGDIISGDNKREGYAIVTDSMLGFSFNSVLVMV